MLSAIVALMLLVVGGCNDTATPPTCPPATTGDDILNTTQPWAPAPILDENLLPSPELIEFYSKVPGAMEKILDKEWLADFLADHDFTPHKAGALPPDMIEVECGQTLEEEGELYAYSPTSDGLTCGNGSAISACGWVCKQWTEQNGFQSSWNIYCRGTGSLNCALYTFSYTEVHVSGPNDCTYYGWALNYNGSQVAGGEWSEGNGCM